MEMPQFGIKGPRVWALGCRDKQSLDWELGFRQQGEVLTPLHGNGVLDPMIPYDSRGGNFKGTSSDHLPHKKKSKNLQDLIAHPCKLEHSTKPEALNPGGAPPLR